MTGPNWLGWQCFLGRRCQRRFPLSIRPSFVITCRSFAHLGAFARDPCVFLCQTCLSCLGLYSKEPSVSNPFSFMDPIVDSSVKIAELKELSGSTDMDMSGERLPHYVKLVIVTRKVFDGLSPWERVQLSRHPARPQTSDYIDFMVDDFVPLVGDRAFADDHAIIAGLGTIDGVKCMIIGQQKGKDVHERNRCNFGMPHPEGYRKAMLKMKMAEKFGLPIITLINTPGAFPGIGICRKNAVKVRQSRKTSVTCPCSRCRSFVLLLVRVVQVAP